MNSLDRLQLMLSFVVQATLLTAVACAVDRRCPIASIKTRVWSFYYIGLAGVLVGGLFLPRFRWANPWAGLSANNLLTVIRTEEVLASVLLAAWLGGSCVLLVRWIVSSWKLRRFLHRCRPVDSSALARLRSLAPEALLTPQGREIEFRVGPEELGPACYQLHRPVVFLPPSLLDGAGDELLYVVHHELEHLRTEHPLQVFAQRLAQTTFWFLPMVWAAGRKASLAREFVCDDAATSQGGSTARYLKTLLRFAQRYPECDAAVMGAARSASELKLRAQRLAAPTTPAGGWLASHCHLAVLMAAFAASLCWLPTNPQASAKSHLSPWPVWSAAALHAFDVSVRDFDEFDARLQVHELIEGRRKAPSSAP